MSTASALSPACINASQVTLYSSSTIIRSNAHLIVIQDVEYSRMAFAQATITYEKPSWKDYELKLESSGVVETPVLMCAQWNTSIRKWEISAEDALNSLTSYIYAAAAAINNPCDCWWGEIAGSQMNNYIAQDNEKIDTHGRNACRCISPPPSAWAVDTEINAILDAGSIM
jgi:hypothetical protein